jgi:hypothetical protein
LYLFVWESGDGVRDNGGRGESTVPSSSEKKRKPF